MLENLKAAGCRTVYVDGSFVTSKELPNDYDACWEEAGVDPETLDPVLLTFDAGRATQKAKILRRVVSGVGDRRSGRAVVS